MATDIMDKDLGARRKARWEKAFSQEQEVEGDSVATNRKATIVLEHLMQASDVSHTMQHWVVFKKWNERLFVEMYQAFLNGRSDRDPSEGWYQGELGFFDYYIIPLAKKLETCGVFGVSSHRAEHWWFFNGGLEYDSDVQDPAYADFYGPPRPGPSPSFSGLPPQALPCHLLALQSS